LANVKFYLWMKACLLLLLLLLMDVASMNKSCVNHPP
jgi:hypothetical protein